MAKKIALFTQAERTRRNAWMGAAIGKCLGFGLLAVPVCLIAGICAVREAWKGIERGPGDPDLFPNNALWRRSVEASRQARQKGDDDDD